MKNFDPLNVLVAGLGFLTSFAIGILFTPYLVHSLGIGLYGYIPLALAFVGYFSFLTQAMSISLNRRLTEFFNESERYSEVMTAAIAICVVLAGCFAVVFTPILSELESIFKISDGYVSPVRAVFFATMFSMLLSVILIPYNAVLFSCHRHYVLSLLTTSQSVVRVFLIVVLFTFVSADLTSVAFAIGLSALLGSSLTMISARYFRPSLRLRLPENWRLELKAMTGTGGGVLLTQVGTVVIFSIDLLAVNYFFGADTTGNYAASAQWAYAARSLVVAVSAVFSSRILALYFEKDIELLVSYAKQRMRLLGVMMALPVGFLCATSPVLLELWLGPEFRSNWPIMLALLIPIAINGSQMPLLSISVAANKVYVPGWVTITTGVALIALIFLVGNNEFLGPEWIAISVSFVLFSKYVLFSTWYAAANIGKNPLLFYKPILMTCLWCVYAGGLGYWLCLLWVPESLLAYVALGGAVSFLYLIGISFTLPRQDLVEFLEGLRGLGKMQFQN